MRLYIKAMSESKKKIRSDIQNHALQVACNICKLTLFKNTEYDDHWKGEAWSNLSSVKKLSKLDQFPSADFIEQSFYSGLPDSFRDVIMFARAEEEDLEVDTDFNHKKTFNVMREYVQWVSDNLSKKGIIDKFSSKDKLTELISKYYPKKNNNVFDDEDRPLLFGNNITGLDYDLEVYYGHEQCEDIQPYVTLSSHNNKALVSIDIHPNILKTSNGFPVQVLDDHTREYIYKLRKILMRGWYKYISFDNFESKLYQKIYEY